MDYVVFALIAAVVVGLVMTIDRTLQAAKGNDRIVCPFCKHLLRRGAVVCPGCGRDLPPL